MTEPVCTTKKLSKIGARHRRSLYILLTLLIILVNWLPSIESLASDILDDMLSNGLLVYASARGLNAVISVLQSVEMSLSFGAGVAIQFGEILDPLNDLIERFSAFLLYVLIAAGLQEFLHSLFSSVAVKFVFTISLLVLCITAVTKNELPRRLHILLLTMVVLRVGLLVQVAVAGWLEHHYFSERENSAMEAIDATSEELSTVQAGYSSTGATEHWLSMLFPSQSPSKILFELKDRVDITSKAILDLMLLFFLKGLLLPALYFYALYRLILAFIAIPKH